MALGINTNVASISAQNQLSNSQKMNDQALERLSSGLRINSAKDDAAGLAISTRFQSQISGLSVAQRNANDGISFAQTAEGALGEISGALSRIRDLAVQSSNDTNSASDRQALNEEVSSLISEVNRIAETTQFNGQNILDGALSSLSFQVGANEGQTIAVSGVDVRGTKLGAEVSEGGSFDVSGLDDGASFDINGETITVGAASEAGAGRTEDVIRAINEKAADTGVTAYKAAETEVNLGAVAVSGGETLTINGYEINAETGDDVDSLVAKINDNAAQTGVVASNDGSNNLVLTSKSGGQIEVTESADTLLDGTTTDYTTKTTFDAGIKLTSDIGASINLTAGSGDLAEVSLGSTTDSTASLNNVKVTTREEASSAITAVDFALQSINTTRAELGAVQSRFDSTISNLASTSENLSAANSRILDADFAAETAKLAKSQVLQQAGISVLSQANARPQQVLSLLQ